MSTSKNFIFYVAFFSHIWRNEDVRNKEYGIACLSFFFCVAHAHVHMNTAYITERGKTSSKHLATILVDSILIFGLTFFRSVMLLDPNFSDFSHMFLANLHLPKEKSNLACPKNGTRGRQTCKTSTLLGGWQPTCLDEARACWMVRDIMRYFMDWRIPRISQLKLLSIRLLKMIEMIWSVMATEHVFSSQWFSQL